MSNAIDRLIKSNGDGLAVLKTLAENSFDSILITDATENGDIVVRKPSIRNPYGF